MNFLKDYCLLKTIHNMIQSFLNYFILKNANTEIMQLQEQYSEKL